jgi:hypothetical protein
MGNNMSNLADFSGSGTPIGSLMPIADSATPLLSINGQDWLRTGVLSPIAAYPTLELSYGSLALNIGAQKVAYTSATPYAVLGAGGVYYKYDAATLQYSTDLITWAASTGGAMTAPPIDGAMFGNYAIFLDATNPPVRGLSAVSAAIAGPTASTNQTIAVNAAGTLAVIHQGNNGLYTATTANGAWTSRTQLMGGGSQTCHMTWSAVGATFVKLQNNAHAWTGADGFTDVDRGLISGLSGGSISQNALSLRSQACAYTSGATLISVFATAAGGAAAAYIIRTTDGINFVATPAATLLGLDARVPVGTSATVPKLLAVGDTLYAYTSPKSGQPTGYIYRSLDHGATWAKIALPISLAASAAGILSALSVANGNIVTMSQVGANAQICRHTSMAATHAGIAAISDTATGSTTTIPNYVRLK